jgi:hypothetical protein
MYLETYSIRMASVYFRTISWLSLQNKYLYNPVLPPRGVASSTPYIRVT